MTRLLAGDIGGTKSILRLEDWAAGTRQILAEKVYPSASYTHLNLLVEEFLVESGGVRPQLACLAIAGPVVNNTAYMTNLAWQLQAEEMATTLNIPRIQLINDFVAVGYGILALQPQDLYVLQDQPVVAQAPIAVLGAGTGLGETLLVWQSNQYEVLPLEGGHTDFPARNQREIGLLHYLQTQFGRVSVERVVSGQGIVSIYEYLAATGFAPESARVRAAMAQQDPAAVISAQALAQSDPLCEQALEMFVAAYGAEAGNLALKSLPFGGLFVAGGITPKILAKLQDGTFIQNFLDKGRMKPLMEKIRVSLILNPKVGLIGAAFYAQRLHDREAGV